MIIPVLPESLVHRIGGASVENLMLKRAELKLVPPGISELMGGTAEQAADDMRMAYPTAPKWKGDLPVASATVGAVRTIGFDVFFAPTPTFPNHARLVHPDGVAGFSDVNLAMLAMIFRES